MTDSTPTAADASGLLSPEDYERMFRVVHGLLRAERGDPAKACLYFGVIGALLLEQYHQLRAVPVVGMAGYRLGDAFLVFAHPDGGRLSATANAFHCWVEIEGFVVDLQAPLFSEALASVDPRGAIPRRMMVKSFASASDTPQDLGDGGTHWHHHDPELHATLLTPFVARRANQDLAQIAAQWYRPFPAPMREAIRVGDARGQVKDVPLSPLRLDGAW